MGVYIKGMEMPKDCPMCPLSHWNAINNFTGCDVVGGKRYAMVDQKYANSNVRPDWCPLVPISTHGRLIDADAMEKTMSDAVQGDIRGYPYSDTLWDTAFQWIDHQPTIIEAEGE